MIKVTDINPKQVSGLFIHIKHTHTQQNANDLYFSEQHLQIMAMTVLWKVRIFIVWRITLIPIQPKNSFWNERFCALDQLIFLFDLFFSTFRLLLFKSLKPLFQPHKLQEGIKRNQLRHRDTAPLCGYPTGIQLAGVPGDQLAHGEGIKHLGWPKKTSISQKEQKHF